MQQSFNKTVNHRVLPEYEQSAIVLKQLAKWLGRSAARNTFNNQSQTDETIH